MACINCDSCKEIQQRIPACYTGNITLTEGLSLEADYLILTEKYNGSKIEIKKADDGAGNMVASLIQLCNDTEASWFQPGAYKITIFDLNREPVTLTEPGGTTTAECLMLKIIGTDAADNAAISVIYE